VVGIIIIVVVVVAAAVVVVVIVVVLVVLVVVIVNMKCSVTLWSVYVRGKRDEKKVRKNTLAQIVSRFLAI
jgi:uncharacterized protein HemY